MPSTSVSLGISPSSAAAAREFARERLEAAGWDAEASERVILLVSELVTNAIVHADSVAELTIDLTDDLVHVTVIDDSPSPPVLTKPFPSDTASGRGMHLVQHLSTSWGVEPHPRGKCVWFLLRRS